MTDLAPTPDEATDAIFDLAYRPDGFPEESDYALDRPKVLAALGETAAADARDQYEQARAGWAIDGEKTAAWAAHRLRRALDRRAEGLAAAQAMRDAANEYERKVTERTEHDRSFFEAKLRDWYLTVGGEGKTKTRTVLGAKLAEAVGSVSTAITEDEDELRALLDWLEENRPEAIDYGEPKVKKAALADLQGKVDKKNPGDYPAVDAETGEVVPGVTFVRGTPRFTVTLTDVDDPAADE